MMGTGAGGGGEGGGGGLKSLPNKLKGFSKPSNPNVEFVFNTRQSINVTTMIVLII